MILKKELKKVNNMANMKTKLLNKTLGKNAYWALNKQLVKSIGLEATLILQHIIDLQSVFKKEEIFQSQPDMAKELGITEYAIKNRIVELSKAGLINVIKKGVPAKNYYSINEDKIIEILDKPLDDVKSTDLSVDFENDGSVNTISTGQSVDLVGTGDIENISTITNNTDKEYKNNNTTNNTSIADKNIAYKRLTEIIELADNHMNSEAKEKIFALIEDFNSVEEAIQLVYPNDSSVLKKHLDYFNNILNTK